MQAWIALTLCLVTSVAACSDDQAIGGAGLDAATDAAAEEVALGDVPVDEVDAAHDLGSDAVSVDLTAADSVDVAPDEVAADMDAIAGATDAASADVWPADLADLTLDAVDIAVDAPACPSPCDDGDPCSLDTCVPGGGCLNTLIAGCVSPCGDGFCGGEETVTSCPADCAFLINHYGGPCATPGSWAGCKYGYVCVARDATAGGDICVADFETWQPLPDDHTATDFQDLGDYVTDNLTGLSWAKQVVGKNTWAVGLTACTTESYGGYNDWRLPTEAELLTLVNHATYSPASSAPGLESLGPTQSSTPTWNTTDRWAVALTDGAAETVSIVFKRFSRCVRADVKYGSGSIGIRLAVSADGSVVLDRVSGRTWARKVGPKLWYSDAQKYCAGNSAGLPGSAWRLPTVGELTQLVDRQDEAVFASIFGPNQYWGGWTSTPGWQPIVAPTTQAISWAQDLGKWVWACSPSEAGNSVFNTDPNMTVTTQCVR